MCILCVEFMKGKMTINEGWRNLSETRESLEPEHVEAVEDMLWNAWYEKNPASRPGDSPGDDEEDWYQEHGQGD